MLDLWNRFIQFHELKVVSDPPQAPYIPLQDLCTLLTNEIDAGNAVKLINNESAAIRFSKYQQFPAENVLIFLVQYTDRNISDPAFQDLNTGELRTEPKLDGEGIAVSAHIAISLESHDDINVLYHLLLEEVPGLGRSRLSPFFKSEFKKLCKDMYQFIDPTNGKRRNYHPNTEILGKPSKNLEAELDEGVRLQGIEIVRMTPAEPEFDEEGYYHEVSNHIHIAPEKDSQFTPKQIIELIKRKAFESGYDNIKVRYKRATGKQKTTVMGADMGDLADAMINRDELIRADEVLSQCSEEIIDSIATRMVQYIVDLRQNGD
ncbi:MAG: hypothetical protein JAZ15_21955 [Candidatus Thiodiazotropha endolucinida]|nr:hypothetical protein [Candidatus Thiodiazotropha taylori]MCW4315682.1 hypothetical protein [Candidatus Thiodiazotropha taylori]